MSKPVVLFVDDDPGILEGFQRVFAMEDYALHTAQSAERALEILRRTPVDVVVSDEQMPGMSGTRFLAKVRREYPDTVRIILTGHASVETTLRAINKGEVYRFLLKPCNLAELSLTIRQALQIRELARQSARLLARYRKQRLVITELEKTHPGITRVERSSDGAVVIDEPDTDLEGLLQEIRKEMRAA